MKTTKPNNWSLLVIGSLVITAVVSSCDDKRVFEDNVSITKNQWNINQVVRFDVRIVDTLTKNNLYINVRNGGAYKFSNLYLFIRTYMPNGKIILDTLECILADEEGRWLGRGTGHILDNRIPFKKNVIFKDTGIYRFEIEQAMRMEVLPEIYDIGLRIEKAD